MQVLVKLGGAGSVLYGEDGSPVRQAIFKVDKVHGLRQYSGVAGDDVPDCRLSCT